MGRYTTVQAYSDNNPKLVHVSYDQAKAKDAPDGSTAGGKLVVEKTDQVMGSCAGAGSGEFHTYRAHRRREMHRVAAIDEEMQQDEAVAKLQAAVEKGQQECEERTRKKAEKRKRKKQAAKGAKNASKHAKPNATTKESSSSGTAAAGSSGGGTGSSSDGDAAEEFVYISVADRAASGGDGGAPAAYKNDGSFLEMMKKELEGAAPEKAALVTTSGGTPVAAK